MTVKELLKQLQEDLKERPSMGDYQVMIETTSKSSVPWMATYRQYQVNPMHWSGNKTFSLELDLRTPQEVLEWYKAFEEKYPDVEE